MRLGAILRTFLVSAPGGMVFTLLNIPLPWMLGPLTLALIYNNLGPGRARWSIAFRNAGLVVIGYCMGRTVTAATASKILANLPAMAAVTILMVLFCLATAYLVHRYTGISLASSILGSMPGGLGQMVLLSEEIKGADLTVVTVMQMMRVLSVVFLIPFIATYGLSPHGVNHLPLPPVGPTFHADGILPLILAPVGAWVATRLKIPIPYLLGPIFTTACCSLAGLFGPQLPRPLIITAQIFFGIYMGVIISLDTLRKLGRVFRWSLASSLALIAFTYLISNALAMLTPATVLSAFLGIAPGGITEMGVVALALHADVAFVTAFQLFRLFSILLAVPPLLRWGLTGRDR